MADLYENICHFEGNPTIQNITNGWDTIYAITYDTINADIALRELWNDSDIEGKSLYGSASQIDNFSIISLELITGTSAPYLDWKLTASGLYQDGTNTATITFSAHIVTKPKFSASPSMPGLHYLMSSSSTPVIKSITVLENNVDGAVVNLRDLLNSLLPDYQQFLFGGTLASVISTDYAESVNVPWLTPTYFTHALSVMSNTEETGILAILSTSKESLDGLVASFDGSVFPIDDDINAAMFISSTTLGTESFTELLNNAVGDSMLSAFKPDDQANLFNDKELKLSYRIDPDTGAATLMTETGAQSAGGRYYPATIPAGKLIFSVGTDAIEIAIDEMNVDFGGGAKMLVTVKTEFQLIVNSSTQEIDIALKGSPKITTQFTQGVASTAEEYAPLVSAALATLISELIAYKLDRVGSLLLETTAEKMRQYHLDFQAAMAQAEAGSSSVSFSIGFGKKMVVSYEDEAHVSDKQAIKNAQKLESNFQSRLKFDPERRIDLPQEETFAYQPLPEEHDNSQLNNTQQNNTRQDTQHMLVQDLDVSQNAGIHADLSNNGVNTSVPGTRLFYDVRNGRNVLTGYSRSMGSQFKKAVNSVNVREVRRLPKIRGVRQNIQLQDFNLTNVNHNDAALNITPALPTHAQQQENIAALNADVVRVRETQERQNNRLVVDRFCSSVKDTFEKINSNLIINKDSTVTLGRGKFAEFFLGKLPVVRDVLNGAKTISELNTAESKALYKACAEFMNEGYINGKVSASDYINAIREFNVLSVTGNINESVTIGGWKTPSREPNRVFEPDADRSIPPVLPGDRTKTLRILTESMEKPIQRVMSGYLDDLHSTMLSNNQSLPFGSPSATEALIRNAVVDAKKPFLAKSIGCFLYGMGLVAGYYGGNWISGLSDKYIFDGAGEKRKDAAAKASENAAAAYVGAADMLFKNVSFPLMTNFLSGQSVPVNNEMPSPSNVLVRAAVKGGLVLGVSITFDLTGEA